MGSEHQPDQAWILDSAWAACRAAYHATDTGHLLMFHTDVSCQASFSSCIAAGSPHRACRLCRVSLPLGEKVISLPKESWASMSSSNGTISIQAGVRLDEKSMYVARMDYKDLEPHTAFLGIDTSA